MNRVLTACTLILVALNAFSEPLRVHLVLSPEHTLPGIPVIAEIIVTNTSGAPVTISQWFQFQIATPGGTPITFSELLQRGIWQGSGGEDRCVINAGEEARFYIPFDVDFVSQIFAHPELNRPGEYDLTVQVKLLHGLRTTSAPTHLSVSYPTGDDLTVWKALIAGRDELLSVNTMDLCQVIAKFPQSNYTNTLAPFCVARALRGTNTSREEYVRRVVSVADSLGPAYRDAIRFEIGRQFWVDAEHAAFGLNQHAAAGRIAEEGRAYADDLINNPGTDFGAAAGAWLKSQLVTESEWRDRYVKSHAPRQEQNIVPFVYCVAPNEDGTFSAQFGFKNPNSSPVKRPRGSINTLTGEHGEVLPPQDFMPGNHESAFTIKAAKGSVSWTLNGKTATASSATTPLCSDLTFE